MECVASVRKLTYPNIHIVIVDNGSTDDSVAILKQNYPEVRVIVNATNLGFAAGNNIGIRYALSRGADYVLLLNNDTIVAPDMLENMVAAGEAVPQIGILAPKIYYYKTQKLWRAGGRRRKLTLGATDTGIGREDDEKYNIPREIDYAFGSGMLIKREVFEQVGLFDEGYFMYYEDCICAFEPKNVAIAYFTCQPLTCGTKSPRAPAETHQPRSIIVLAAACGFSPRIHMGSISSLLFSTVWQAWCGMLPTRLCGETGASLDRISKVC